jgi:predicted nucleic acid-binding protein
MILVDTNILSTFAKIKRMDLIFKVFGKNCFISPNVLNEIKKAHQLGYEFSEIVIKQALGS